MLYKQESNTQELAEGYISNGNYIGNKGPWFGARYVQILLLSYCIAVGMCSRASLSVQIVAMNAQNTSSPNPDIPIYPEWEHSDTVLSAFFWLYVDSTLFAAPLEKKFGVKWILFCAIFLNNAAYIVIPLFAATFGENGALFCRLLQGLGQGFMLPSQQTILGLWAPTEERSRAVITVNTGNTLGTMFSSIIPGLMSPTWWGWPSSFYIIGAIGFLWCALYGIFGQDSPATHPSISAEEKRYIQMSLNQHQTAKIPVPYIAMATSIHVWATLVAHIGVAWCSNMVITESNRYLDKIMHFDIKSNGVYSALAPAIALMSGFIFGPLSDFLITKQYLQTVNARRIFHMTGASGIAVSVICLSFLNENQKPISILLMVTIYVSQAAMACGNVINMIDLSPRFAGIIFGFSNATGQAIALFAPISVEYIVTNDHEITQWRIIFLLTATIIFCTALFFVIFASGERQKWDGPEGPQIQRRSNLSIAEGPAIFVTVKYGN